jgi:hypothetical protein
MAAQKERSRASKTKQGRRGAATPEVGWGFGLDDEPEDIVLRRVLFFVLVLVVGCTGAWFLVTTLGERRGEGILLSVTGSAADPSGLFYTVKLAELEPSGDVAERLNRFVERASRMGLAEAGDFYRLRLADGRHVLCVGRFESEESPELRALCERFRSYRAGSGRPFEDAAIYNYSLP